MEKEANKHLDLKRANRNKIFNKIHEAGSISSSALSYGLQLSRPTVKQNLDELSSLGYICENGSQRYTGGRRAKAYSVVGKSKIAARIDLTRRHVTVILADLSGNLIYEKRIKCPFSLEDGYMRQLGELVREAVESQNAGEQEVLGVGIAVPGLITEDHGKVFYGEILGFTGMTAEKIGKYIPYPCRLYNDADAAGYAEISQAEDGPSMAAWREYLRYLSMAVNNVRMLFDCEIILGGYVGAYLEKYLPELKGLVAARNPFESHAEYLRVCRVKKETLAMGGALPFIHEFWAGI